MHEKLVLATILYTNHQSRRLTVASCFQLSLIRTVPSLPAERVALASNVSNCVVEAAHENWVVGHKPEHIQQFEFAKDRAHSVQQVSYSMLLAIRYSPS